MSPGGPPSPPRRRRPRRPPGAARRARQRPGTPRGPAPGVAWPGPARPGSGPPDLAFRPSCLCSSRAAGREAKGKASGAPWHRSLRFSPRFPSITPSRPPPPALPRRPPASPSPNHSPTSFPLPAVRVPLPSGLGEGGERTAPAGAGGGLQSRPFCSGSEALRMLEDGSSEQYWAPELAGAGGLLPHPGTAWATGASRVGRTADGEIAGRFLPQGLAGLASFRTACKGHRPHCCSGSFEGKKMGCQPQQPALSREKRSWSRGLKKCGDPEAWEGWELSHCLGSRH